MRVVTWNMAYWSHRRHHERAWRWVLKTLQPDVLLCQESVPPEWVHRDWTVLWDRAYPSSKQPWGTGIVTRFPARRSSISGLDAWLLALPPDADASTGPPLIHRADGWVSSATIELPGLGETLVASVHSPAAPFARTRLTGIDITPMRLKLNPDLWLLDVLFFYLRSLLGQRLLVGGDFNYSRLLDVTLGKGKPRGNNEFFDRVGAEGFVSLHRKFHPGDERTFFHKRRAHHQLDYLYADSTVSAITQSCVVHPYDEIAEFSDHAPIVAELDVSAGLNALPMSSEP